jgi:uncharacterized cupredoxin-like copper-binding protein
MRPSSALLFGTLVAAALGTGAQAGPGYGEHNHTHATDAPYGQPGDASKKARIVKVVMDESDSGMVFAPSRIEVRRGEQIQFALRNEGELEHELVIGTVETNSKHAKEMNADPEMAHEDPNAKRLGPKQSGVLRWQFTKAGTFEYACLIPGHREAGMVGTIVVK